MLVTIACPNPACCKPAKISDEHFGRSVRCNHCRTKFAISAKGEVVSRAAPAAESLSTPRPNFSTYLPDRPPSSPGELPEQFGRYRILRKLGRGGMGAVYLAQDTMLSRQVALKVPYFAPEDGPEVLERFTREARALATLNHPNVCAVHDVGAIDGIHYLTMAHVEGQKLSEMLRVGMPMEPRKAAVLVEKLATALTEAHARGVIHRDLKPSNIMINQRGEPVLIDFGLAHLLNQTDSRLTKTGAVLGTPAYMAPEQVAGEVRAMGPACDIYSLGVLLYEMLSGRLPFEGPATAVLAKILTQEPVPPSQHRPGLDPALEAICLRAMAKQVPGRYATMAEFAAALAGWVRDAGPGSSPGSRVPVSTPAPSVREPAPSRRSAPSALPTPSRPPSPVDAGEKPRRLPRWVGMAIWEGLALLLLAGGVSWWALRDGFAEIALNEPATQVEVWLDGVPLDPRSLPGPMRLRPGEHSLEVKGSDFETFNTSFTVLRGENALVAVTLQRRPKVKAPPPVEPGPKIPKEDPPQVARDEPTKSSDKPKGPKEDPPAPAKQSLEDYWPENTQFVMTANVKQILASPFVKTRYLAKIEQTFKEFADIALELRVLGLNPLEDLDRVMWVGTDLSRLDERWVVFVEGRFQLEKIREYLKRTQHPVEVPDGRGGRVTLYETKDPTGNHYWVPLHATALVFSPCQEYVLEALDKAAGRKPVSPHNATLRTLASRPGSSDAIWVALAASGLPDAEFLNKTRTFTGRVTLDAGARLDGTGTFPDAATATAFAKELNEKLQTRDVLDKHRLWAKAVARIQAVVEGDKVRISGQLSGEELDDLLGLIPLDEFVPKFGKAKPAAPAPPAVWKEFSPPLGRFKVSMPGTPKADKKSQKTLAGMIVTHHFSVEVSGGAGGYLVTYADHPEGSMPDDRDKALDTTRLAIEASVPGSKVVDERKVKLDGHPGRELVLEGPGRSRMRVHVYLVNRREYKLLAGGDREPPTRADIDRFFESFRLLPK